MSSLWNRSGTIERYADDLRAGGAKAYFFLGGTTTPYVVYQDSGEAAAHPHPVVADANGRWPDIFVPYVTSYDVRVTDAFGVQLTYSLMIPNPNPVEVDITVDPVSTVQTGMIHCEMVNTTKAGYVRLNGRTMGNGASTGTERAHADTEDLFIYGWNNWPDAVAPVSGGRGGSGAADFAANKTITLPSWQGVGPVGLDDMGATAGSFFTGLTFDSGSAIIPGSLTGSNALVIITANLPPHSHIGTTDNESAHTHSGTTGNQSADHTHAGSTVDSAGAHQHAAFIGDDGHTHAWSRTGDDATGAPLSGGRIAGGVNSETTLTFDVETEQADVRVRSTAGAAATADDQVASGGAHTHPFTSAIQSASHTHSFTSIGGTAHSHTFTTGLGAGTSVPINNLGRSRLVTWFIKL